MGGQQKALLTIPEAAREFGTGELVLYRAAWAGARRGGKGRRAGRWRGAGRGGAGTPDDGAAARRLGLGNRRIDQLRRRGDVPPALVTPLGRLSDAADVERRARERG
jgi:hypothetical protein